MRLATLTAAILFSLCSLQDAFAATAEVASAIGTVRVRMKAGKRDVKGIAGMRLPEGAVVATGKTGRAQIRFSSTDLVRLGPETQLKIAQVKKGDRGATILRLLVGNVRAMINRKLKSTTPDFGIAAGNGICAVKGTDFVVINPQEGPPVFIVNLGSILVGQGSGGGWAALQQTFNGLAGGSIGHPVGSGYQLTVPPVQAVGPATKAPVNTVLEVVTGTVRVVVGGQETEVGPGEEIPAGAKIVAADESAVLVGTKSAISVESGSEFTYDAKVEDGEISVVVSVGSGSKSVTVEAGESTVEVSPGSTVEFDMTSGVDPTFNVTVGKVVVTDANGDTQTLEGDIPAAGDPGDAPPGDEPPPDEPPADEPPDDPGDAPPPPPDTTNQDVEIISPSAP